MYSPHLHSAFLFRMTTSISCASMKPVAVLLADDPVIIREGVVALLQQNDIEITGEAENGQQR